MVAKERTGLDSPGIRAAVTAFLSKYSPLRLKYDFTADLRNQARQGKRRRNGDYKKAA